MVKGYPLGNWRLSVERCTPHSPAPHTTFPLQRVIERRIVDSFALRSCWQNRFEWYKLIWGIFIASLICEWWYGISWALYFTSNIEWWPFRIYIFCQKPFHTSTVTPLVEFKRDGICTLSINYSQMILMIFRWYCPCS